MKAVIVGRRGERIPVAEQAVLFPLLAARLDAIRDEQAQADACEPVVERVPCCQR